MSKKKQPWPTKKAMIQVYEKDLWGKGVSEFFSGEGSHQPAIVTPYVGAVKSFLASLEEKPTICDLGCGDFNIGKEFVTYSKQYTAIDIVPDLISYNQQHFIVENLDFKCLDIAKDELPIADVAILRQVLQHLSNDEINIIIKKLYSYKYVILTEHIPTDSFEANVDIISGQGIRIKKHSGVDLLEDPFNFKVKKHTNICSVLLGQNKGIIVTYLYEV
jgi:hypothetical protein